MRTQIISWLTAAHLVSGAIAQEQKSSVNLTMEHRHTIVEILKETGVQRQAADGLKPGEVVAASVQLTPVPAALGAKVPQIKEHMYFLTGNEIVLVSEKDRQIADVIEIKR